MAAAIVAVLCYSRGLRTSMNPSRRHFLAASALSTAALPLALAGCGRSDNAPGGDTAAGSAPPLPEAIQALQPVASQIVPIREDERRARLQRAQQLMAENKLDAIFMRGGSSLFYYTGMHWFNS